MEGSALRLSFLLFFKRVNLVRQLYYFLMQKELAKRVKN